VRSGLVIEPPAVSGDIAKLVTLAPLERHHDAHRLAIGEELMDSGFQLLKLPTTNTGSSVTGISNVTSTRCDEVELKDGSR